MEKNRLKCSDLRQVELLERTMGSLLKLGVLAVAAGLVRGGPPLPTEHAK